MDNDFNSENSYHQYQDPNSSMNGCNNYNNYNNYSSSQGSYYNNDEHTRPLTLGEWIVTLLVPMIPCVGIIFYFVWAFGKNVNVNRKNFCRANLIIMGVLLLIYLVVFGLMGSSIFPDIM